jgi:glycosyltransferase involved in cell wall biosynthesis
VVAEPLVTIALPVFNGGDSLESVARSVLSQDYEHLELLIADNASTDRTPQLCQELARTDSRVRYHRHPHNVGPIPNFEWTKRNARGEFFRWIGDSDALRPDYVTSCLEVLAPAPRIVLVTTQLEYLTRSGGLTMPYDADALGSDDTVTRLQAMLELLTSNYLLLDPLYSLMRTAVVRSITHDHMLRGDEVYAVKLALAGPWGHIPRILAHRHWSDPSASQLATMLEVPWWHTRVRGMIEARRMLDAVAAAHLPQHQDRRARAAVRQFYLRRHLAALQRRGRRIRSELGMQRKAKQADTSVRSAS